ncbi:pleiotropic regulatory protein RsmS [Pseudoalteromonas fenneropenaei]|uniref:Pleiotropic regulatory protein RsmS n=1 Tax=Pseudoalteromonas fenneropenaei TaxID=1737459 RepID=A0ABV7CM25_9GAMM
MTHTLETAPDHVQLAVDLILLLEQNDIPAAQALRALAIVTQDYQHKLELEDNI